MYYRKNPLSAALMMANIFGKYLWPVSVLGFLIQYPLQILIGGGILLLGFLVFGLIALCLVKVIEWVKLVFSQH